MSRNISGSSALNPLDALQRHGYNTHSFLSLYPGIEYFWNAEGSAYIPYVQTRKIVLAAGEPIGPDEAIPDLVTAFLQRFRKERKYVGFIPVSQKLTPVLQACGFDKVHIGREPVFHLQNLPKPHRSIRQAIRRAGRRGMSVTEYDPAYEPAIQTLCARWQTTHEIPAMGFLFQLRPLEGREQKKYFLLVDDQDRLMAMLACSPIYGRNGWYLEDFIRDPDMPNGGSELLIQSALEMLAAEGYELATLAAAPLAGLPDRDESHPLANEILKIVYRRLSFIYHFQTLEFFKGKFGPNVWEDNSFCFYPKGLTPGLALAMIEAFLPGGIPAIIMHKLRQWASLDTLKRLVPQKSREAS